MNEIIEKFRDELDQDLLTLQERGNKDFLESTTNRRYLARKWLSNTKEIDGHQYGLKIVQLDGELPLLPAEEQYKELDGLQTARDMEVADAQAGWMRKAGFRYRIIEEEK